MREEKRRAAADVKPPLFVHNGRAEQYTISQMNGERRVPSEVKVSAYLLFYVQVALSRRVTTLSKGANSSEGSFNS